MATISALGIGSGLDLNGLLEQLEAVERQKLTPIVQQKQSYQSKISAYGVLQNALNQFQTAVGKLSDAEMFSAVKSSVTGSSMTAAAGNSATAGVYQVNVEQLATHYSVATKGIEDKTAQLGAATLTFIFGDNEAEPLVVNIEEGKSSLEDIRNAINAAGGGVTASIVNDGDPNTPWRLSLASSETGGKAAIAAVDFGDLGSQLELDGETEVAADNALLKVNGITISSQRNQVEGAIEGVTLALTEKGTSTLRISQDNEGITEAVKGFVSAYNTLQSTMSRLTSYDQASDTAGDLLGDTALRNVQSRLRMEMTGMLSDGELRRLSDLGISVQLKGDLKIDEEKLSELVSSNPSALAEFFAGSVEGGGFAGQLSTTLEQMVRSEGTIDNAKKGLETSIKSLDTRYVRMEQSIDATISRYRSQFAQLDGMIASMNSTSAYLTQQFDMMNAQFGNRRR